MSVLLQTVNVTATAGTDFTAVSETVTWADGDANDKTIHIHHHAGIERSRLHQPAFGISEFVDGTGRY